MAESTGIKDAEDNIIPVASDDVIINGEPVRVQRTKLGYGRDGEYHDVEEEPATEATLNDIAAILGQLAAMLPRLTATKQIPISIEAGSVGLASNQTLTTVTTVSNLSTIGSQYVNWATLQGAGLAHIYNQIEVT